MNLNRRATPWFLASMLVLSLGACEASQPGADSPLPSPSPSPSFDYRPPPLEDPTDPLLIAYCSMQDRVVTLEGQLLSERIPLAGQLVRMRKAQKAAQLAADAFEKAGKETLSRLMQAWADSFIKVRGRLARGQREIDALRPAIGALGRIEPVFSCELDG